MQRLSTIPYLYTYSMLPSTEMQQRTECVAVASYVAYTSTLYLGAPTEDQSHERRVNKLTQVAEKSREELHAISRLAGR